MKNKSSSKGVLHRCLLYCIAILLLVTASSKSFGQSTGELTTDSLVKMGFENVRWTETSEERIYVIENNVYKLQGVGVAHAIDMIQRNGLPSDKPCRLIVTSHNVPQISLTYYPQSRNTAKVEKGDWQVSYELGKSWDAVKKEEKKNSSLFKVDILIYPQLSYMNLVITQIYQVLFQLSPAVEVSLWPGAKLTGQVRIPVYNDGYGMLQDKVHPGHITLSQRFRLPYNIFAKATIGYFNADRWGADISLFHPFRDERFSVEARLGYTGIGYWNGFKLHYDNKMQTTWSVAGNFYWPKYNTQFSIKGEKYLLGEKGVKFEMIRHFRYTSIGFYAMKAEGANSNGGFRFQVALPWYKMKRRKNIPRVNVSNNMGIVYNAGNERRYYKEYKAEVSDNIMEKNSFNPYFIKSELLNF